MTSPQVPQKIIRLATHDITVTLGSRNPQNPGGHLGGTITSDLHDGDGGGPDASIDVLESFILAAACAGIDITTPAFSAAIDTTLEAIVNNRTDAVSRPIVCCVSGGVLQGVYSHDPQATVTLFDDDAFLGSRTDDQGHTRDEFNQQLEMAIRDLHQVF